MSDLVTRLRELASLRDEGILSDEEFQAQKRALLERNLGSTPTVSTPLSGPTLFEGPSSPPPSSARSGGNSLSGPTIVQRPTSSPSGVPAAAPTLPAGVPARVGSYLVRSVLGAGGMGQVVRARHELEGWAERQGGDVAIKLVHPHLAEDPQYQKRFFAEADLGRRVRHPGVAATHEVLASDGWLGAVMELVPGEELGASVQEGPLSPDAALAMLQPLAEALDHLHEQDIVHRDLKPSNIKVRPDGGPVILDLGVAKDTSRATSGLSVAFTAMGTVRWMAPEQVDAQKVGPSADRYALGLVAYYLLSAELPWPAAANDQMVLVAKAMGKLVPLSARRADLPRGISDAVMKMLSVMPEERFESSAAFIAALGDGPVTRTTARGVTFEEVSVPAGTFMMGASDDDEEAYDHEKPRHEVTLSRGFLMGKTPVTQALWEAVMGENPSYFSACGTECPVEQVSWYDAVGFCNALSQAVGLAPAYRIGEGEKPSVACDFAAPGYRLPSEAEWEYAARAGTRLRYAGGDTVDEVGWYSGNSGKKTHPVAQKAPNAWGLYDMSGNVWEWVWDWYGAYASGVQQDPMGVSTGAYRVVRGGSWLYSSAGLRVSDRYWFAPGYRFRLFGFRLARTIP